MELERRRNRSLLDSLDNALLIVVGVVAVIAAFALAGWVIGVVTGIVWFLIRVAVVGVVIALVVGAVARMGRRR